MESTDESVLFPAEKTAAIREFYATRERWRDILDYRALAAGIGKIDQVFFGDSITKLWPLHEFFPRACLLNRGLGGDNIHGLRERLAEDVLAYRPRRVFVHIGINGIEEDPDATLARIQWLARRLAAAGIEAFLASILPLRHPDNWDRFQYQDRIVYINTRLKEWAAAGGAAGFLDYHAALRDAAGQLAEAFAKPDGTHLTFAAYRRMASVVAPYVLGAAGQ